VSNYHKRLTASSSLACDDTPQEKVEVLRECLLAQVHHYHTLNCYAQFVLRARYGKVGDYEIAIITGFSEDEVKAARAKAAKRQADDNAKYPAMASDYEIEDILAFLTHPNDAKEAA
jgi:hypothetical protein